jgi:hypothetical protein
MTPKTQLKNITTKAVMVSDAKKGHDVKVHLKTRE